MIELHRLSACGGRCDSRIEKSNKGIFDAPACCNGISQCPQKIADHQPFCRYEENPQTHGPKEIPRIHFSYCLCHLCHIISLTDSEKVSAASKRNSRTLMRFFLFLCNFCPILLHTDELLKFSFIDDLFLL